MLTAPKLRSQANALWDKFWTGGLDYLYEPPLDMFGADAVDLRFTEKEVEEAVEFMNRLSIAQFGDL